MLEKMPSVPLILALLPHVLGCPWSGRKGWREGGECVHTHLAWGGRFAKRLLLLQSWGSWVPDLGAQVLSYLHRLLASES